MGKLLRDRTFLICSSGTLPGTLVVSRLPVKMEGKAGACAFDTALSPFGMCRSQKNPLVKEASGGPAPCAPLVTKGWDEASGHVKIQGKPAITDSSTLACAWEGEITVVQVNLSNVEVKG